MDTGCTFPVYTTAIVKGMKAEIVPLTSGEKPFVSRKFGIYPAY